MKKHFCILAAVCIVSSSEPVISQKLIANSSVTGVCYAGNRTNRIYIPPPDDFFKKSAAKGGASITVIYTGFPKNRKLLLSMQHPFWKQFFRPTQILLSLPAGKKLLFRSSCQLRDNRLFRGLFY